MLNVYLSGEIHTDWRENRSWRARRAGYRSSRGPRDRIMPPATIAAWRFWAARRTSSGMTARARRSTRSAPGRGIEEADRGRRALRHAIQAVERGLRCRLCRGAGQVADHPASRKEHDHALKEVDAARPLAVARDNPGQVVDILALCADRQPARLAVAPGSAHQQRLAVDATSRSLSDRGACQGRGNRRESCRPRRRRATRSPAPIGPEALARDLSHSVFGVRAP